MRLNWLVITDQSVFLSFPTLQKAELPPGGPNSRRPDLSYGIDYLQKIQPHPLMGPLDLNVSHRYIGDHLRLDRIQKCYFCEKCRFGLTCQLTKNWFGNEISLNFTNSLK